ncbi:MAG TPA: DUF1259 domain-containing protein [Tepidisphaeraceae bacterium]|jgi:hypothetical protein|nr:DUF1259 domain-containing protein [Tepidisphaeraceae bacterium]
MKLRSVIGFAVLTAVACAAGCAETAGDSGRESPARESAATAPATQPADPAAADISKVLERPGVTRDGVYIVTVPRDDLDVTILGMGIPTAAGIESVFYFYRCPCGKMNVAGQFVTADYESNDVVDALRQNAILRVASIAPMLQYEKPRLDIIRFQGEGDAVAMAKIIREALRWTGKERMAPQKPDTDASAPPPGQKPQ